MAFDLTGQPGSETSAAVTSSVTGVSAGVLARAAGLTPVSGSGSVNASGWSQGATPDKSLYYTFTITPATGCSVTLTSIAVDVKASATGPSSVEVGTSADGYASLSAPFSGTSVETVPLPASGSGPEACASDGATGDDGGSGPEAGIPESGADGSGSTCAAHGFSGALVTFDLSAQSGSEASAAPTSSASGVTGGALSRASGLGAESGAGSINASGWPTASSADPSFYYTFSVTPAAGCTVGLTSLSLDVKASASGPASVSVGTSADAYASLSTAVAGTSTGTVTLGASGAAALTIHVFGYGATSTAGTLRIENTLTLSGTIN